jgi:hypothetical protein
MSKKINSYHSARERLGPDGRSILSYQRKYGFKVSEEYNDPYEVNIYAKTELEPKLTKQERREQYFDTAVEDISTNDIQGELDNENPDLLNDDYGYGGDTWEGNPD